MVDTAKITELTHEGKSFYAYANVTGLANGGIMTMLGRTGALPVHFHSIHVEGSDSPLLLEFIETPTVSNVGTPATIYNRNRRSSNLSNMLVYGAPTFSGGATIDSKRIYKSGVGSATPGAGQIEGEWVLRSNSDYVFRITNNSGTTINLDADFNFYEEEL